MAKFAVSYRLDTRLDSHIFTEKAIEESLKSCILEPVRVSNWNHLKTMYFITTDKGPAVANTLALINPNCAFVYAGSM